MNMPAFSESTTEKCLLCRPEEATARYGSNGSRSIATRSNRERMPFLSRRTEGSGASAGDGTFEYFDGDSGSFNYG